MSTNEIKPDWRVVKVEQKSMCNAAWIRESEITACGVYYVLDANLHVHICSLTPSLEAWPVQGYTKFASESAWERDGGDAEIEMMSTEELCSYFGTEILRQSNRPLSDYIEIPAKEDGESDEDYRARIVEKAREHFAGNPTDFE